MDTMSIKSEIDIKEEVLETHEEYLTENDIKFQSVNQQNEDSEICTDVLHLEKPCISNFGKTEVKLEGTFDEVHKAIVEDNDCDVNADIDVKHEDFEDLIKAGCSNLNNDIIRKRNIGDIKIGIIHEPKPITEIFISPSPISPRLENGKGQTDVMDSRRESESLAEDFKNYLKNINVFTNLIAKLPVEKYNTFIDINKEMKQNFKSEINKEKKKKQENKEKRNKQENKEIENKPNAIESALLKLKYEDDKYDCEVDYRISDICEKIEKEILNFNDDKINRFHNELTEGENNMKNTTLYASFVKSHLYNYFRKKRGKKVEDLQHKFKLEKSQIYYYLNYYDLIMKYNFLLKINLPFSCISKKKKEIERIINSDQELKIVCERKLNLFNKEDASMEWINEELEKVSDEN